MYSPDPNALRIKDAGPKALQQGFFERCKSLPFFLSEDEGEFVLGAMGSSL
jgi:hypothetical protein